MAVDRNYSKFLGIDQNCVKCGCWQCSLANTRQTHHWHYKCKLIILFLSVLVTDVKNAFMCEDQFLWWRTTPCHQPKKLLLLQFSLLAGPEGSFDHQPGIHSATKSVFIQPELKPQIWNLFFVLENAFLTSAAKLVKNQLLGYWIKLIRTFLFESHKFRLKTLLWHKNGKCQNAATRDRTGDL